MNDRHEQSRAAFEAEYPPAHTYKASASIIDHLRQNRDIQWNAWCRALDYAAEQQIQKQCQCDMRTKLVGDGCSVCNPEKAKEYMDDEAPTPLTRPDRPGWWWNWNPHRQEWRCWTVSKPDHEDDGLWLPVTPPPAPRSTQDQ